MAVYVSVSFCSLCLRRLSEKFTCRLYLQTLFSKLTVFILVPHFSLHALKCIIVLSILIFVLLGSSSWYCHKSILVQLRLFSCLLSEVFNYTTSKSGWEKTNRSLNVCIILMFNAGSWILEILHVLCSHIIEYMCVYVLCPINMCKLVANVKKPTMTYRPNDFFLFHDFPNVVGSGCYKITTLKVHFQSKYFVFLLISF